MGQCSISILYLPRLKNTPSLGWSRCMTASCQKKDRKRYYVSVLSSMGTESIHPSIHPSSHSSQVTLTHTFRASNQPVFVGMWEEAGVSGENPPRLGENMLTLHGMIGVGTERTALLPHGDRVFRGTTVLPVFWVIEFYLRWAWGLTCMSGGVTHAGYNPEVIKVISALSWERSCPMPSKGVSNNSYLHFYCNQLFDWSIRIFIILLWVLLWYPI